MNPSLSQKKTLFPWLMPGALLLFFALMIRIVWMSSVTEDAYITFRVVDNAVYGYGLTWNISERVQAYTNPLWMLLHIPFYALWENIFFVTLCISLLCSMVAVLVALKNLPHATISSAYLLLALLLTSNVFVRYSTSGLENPLTHLLCAAFIGVMMRPGPRSWFWLSFITALAAVNRLDTLVFYVPVLTGLALHRRDLNIRQCLFGMLPLLAWGLFSLFYYGFLFPNTKYAKLDTGIGLSAYMEQGWYYMLNLLAMDMVGAGCIITVCMLAMLRWKYLGTQWRLLACGMLAYIFYIVCIGGDHIAGRYLSLPVFVAIWLVSGMADRLPQRVLPATVSLMLLVMVFYPSAATLRQYCASCFAGKISIRGHGITLQDYWFKQVSLPGLSRDEAPRTFIQLDGVGMLGYQAGPYVHIVDRNALADALLARLPAEEQTITRIGHHRRAVPYGYVYALRTGSLEKMDTRLARFYAPLRQIISGKLWDANRFQAILAFNAGHYDSAREAYITRQQP